MLRCVAAPGTPLLAARQQLRGRKRRAEYLLCVAQDADVGGGKSVGMMQAAERDVLRGPFADAGNGAQTVDALLQRVREIKEVGLGYGGAGERLERGTARGGHAQRTEVGRGELLRGGKGMGEGGIALCDGLAAERDQ